MYRLTKPSSISVHATTSNGFALKFLKGMVIVYGFPFFDISLYTYVHIMYIILHQNKKTENAKERMGFIRIPLNGCFVEDHAWRKIYEREGVEQRMSLNMSL